MKIDKLPSGKYRVRKQVDKRHLSLTFDFKPTKKDVEHRVREIVVDSSYVEYRTFRECATAYINSKSNILSPNTIYSYNLMFRIIPKSFLDLRLYKIKQYDIQSFLNVYSKKHKFKTVKNVCSFIFTVIRMFMPNFYCKITLPQRIKTEQYIPNDLDIQNILSAAKGTDEYVPFLIACHGLRRGEICALTMSDIFPDHIIVNKSAVFIKGKGWENKCPKNYSSNRSVPIQPWLYDLIMEKGSIYSKNPNRLSKVLKRIQDTHGLPNFSIHKLRHYNASVNHALGVPNINIQAYNGWSSDSTLKNIYTHKISDSFDTVFSSHLQALISQENGGKSAQK